jgi:hypothetical protein
MHITGQMPVQVSAFAVHSDVLEQYDDFRHNYDAFAMMSCMTDGGALFRFTGCAHMGSHSGYRIVGENGSCETGRSLGGNLNVVFHDWLKPEEKQTNDTYAPTWQANGELAERAGHGGGDFWTVYNFVEYVRNDVPVFFDVYRGCCMSAVAILGWRSCLENGKVYAIPDFKDKAQRDAWRDDDLTPLPDENGNVLIGDVVTVDCKNSIAYSSSRTLTVLGMDGVIAVETKDAILICPKDKAQEVKKIVDELKKSGRESLL